MLPLGVGSGQTLLCALPRLANISMFEVVDEEVERRHQSQEDVAEVKKEFSFNKSKYKIGQWFKHQDHFLGGLIVAIVD